MTFNLKKWGSFFGALAGAAAIAGVATRGGHHPAPAPPQPAPSVPAYTLVVHVCDGDCAADHKIVNATVTLVDRTSPTDGAGNTEFPATTAGSYIVCATAPGFVKGCATIAVPSGGDAFLGLERDVVPLTALATDGPIFVADGRPWRFEGVTAFGLLNLFAKGEDIGGFLEDVRGFNVLRVFWYTPAKEWGGRAWDAPAPAVVLAFLERVARDGFRVELVLLTDDDQARVEPARQLVEALKAARPPNVLIEIGNEPETHKAINVRALKATLDSSGLLYSSGNYEDSRHWFGAWLGAHTGRDAEWPRRAHDLFEYFHGGGPNFPEEPALKVPVVADEPIRPDQATGDRDHDFLAYFATSSLLGAGATFHFESGKYGDRPTDVEKRFAAIALSGLHAFPADAPRGGYRRITEDSLRTYAVGSYMVRVRPGSRNAPESGWAAIDADGILWKR